MDELESELVENPVVSAASPSSALNTTQKTPEELVARSIAPVKREFLRPPPVRPCSSVNHDDAISDTKDKSAQSAVDKEKKSKRQLKRERRQVLSLYFSLEMFVIVYNICICM